MSAWESIGAPRLTTEAIRLLAIASLALDGIERGDPSALWLGKWECLRDVVIDVNAAMLLLTKRPTSGALREVCGQIGDMAYTERFRFETAPPVDVPRYLRDVPRRLAQIARKLAKGTGERRNELKRRTRAARREAMEAVA